jgi:Uma2 family endonuclease
VRAKSPTIEAPVSRRGTPVWELAELWPIQGEWTEEQYLAIETNRLIEFVDGVLEFVHGPYYSSTPESRPGTPVWELAELYPFQGDWSEEDYLELETNRLIEFTDGCLEFLPMPTRWHMLLTQRFFWLHAHVSAHRLGEVYMAPLRVRMGRRRIRQPDVAWLRVEHLRGLFKPPEGAALVMEVVSPGSGNRERDLIQKRQEYAQAGVEEYWIVDPDETIVTVLTLKGRKYAVHGEFGKGAIATSVALDSFEVSVNELFDVPPGESLDDEG